MSDNDPQPSIVLRSLLILAGILLILWALSDDYLVGGGPGFGLVQAVILGAGLIAVIVAFFPAIYGAMLLLTYGSIFVALGLGEMILQSQFGPRYASAFELDSAYLYKLKPGAVREYTHMPANGGGRHQYQINSVGLRGLELPAEKPDMRVVVYGDSFIHAEFSTLKNTFTQQLQQSISLLGYKDFEVLNAGVAGYGPDQIAIRMEQELKSLRPDVVIVSIYSGNDFGDLVRNKLFSLNGNGTIQRLNPTMDPAIVFESELSERELLIRKVLRGLGDQFRESPQLTAPTEKLTNAYVQQVAEFEEFVIREDRMVRELRRDPYSSDIALVARSDSGDYKIALMEGVMKRIRQVVANYGLPVQFIVIPHPTDVQRGTHTSGIVDRTMWPDYDPDRLIGSVTRICENNDMVCFSLMDTMRREGGSELFLSGGDDHWNDQGQTVAAKAVAEFLEAQSVLRHE